MNTGEGVSLGPSLTSIPSPTFRGFSVIPTLAAANPSSTTGVRRNMNPSIPMSGVKRRLDTIRLSVGVVPKVLKLDLETQNFFPKRRKSASKSISTSSAGERGNHFSCLHFDPC